MSLFKVQEVLAFARMTMHFFSNGGDPDFRQDRNANENTIPVPEPYSPQSQNTGCHRGGGHDPVLLVLISS